MWHPMIQTTACGVVFVGVLAAGVAGVTDVQAANLTNRSFETGSLSPGWTSCVASARLNFYAGE